VIIGNAGFGEVTTQRAIGDIVTACGGRGLLGYRPGRQRPGRLRRRDRPSGTHPGGYPGCPAARAALAECRTALLTPLGMGEAWQPSPTHPALVVLVDAYSG